MLGLALNAVAYDFNREFTVMTYNLENLFDFQHDPGKEDYTYLPYEVKRNSPEVQRYCNDLRNNYYKQQCLNMNWSEQVVESKVENLAKVILSYGGIGADIIMFQEVENKRALTYLMKELNTRLSDHDKYKALVLLEGPDVRGIDVAVLSRFEKVGRAKKHHVDIGGRPTRPILEATFKLPGGKLVTTFSNHWPSQRNPDRHRYLAAKRLYEVAKQVKNALIVAAGDFNTVETDSPHGINHFLLNRQNAFHFEDSGIVARKLGVETDSPGSHWYAGHWSALDKIFVANQKFSGRQQFKPMWRDYNILAPKFAVQNVNWRDHVTRRLTEYKNIPFRFNAKTRQGYSDHLPVVMKFSY